MRIPTIMSLKSRPRSSVLGFALSFLFTGLGEFYHGEFSRGLALHVMKILALLCIPAFAVIHPGESILHVFVVLAAAALFLGILSPFYALYLSFRGKNASLKKNHALPLYALYGAVCLLSNFAAVALLTGVIGIVPARGLHAAPLAFSGDILLVNRHARLDPRPGDLLLSGKGRAGRLIAREGESASISGGRIFVDGQMLELGVVRSRGHLPGKLAEHLFAESCRGKRYAVLVRVKDPAPPKNFAVGKGLILLLSDNRLEKDFSHIVPAGSVRGRIEGVLFSPVFSRALRKSLLNRI